MADYDEHSLINYFSWLNRQFCYRDWKVIVHHLIDGRLETVIYLLHIFNTLFAVKINYF